MNPVESQPPPSSTLHIGGQLVARNTVLNLVGRVVPFLVAVATVPYVIRHLGPDRFGLLSLAWIVVGYFALFNLGIGPATTKFVAELLGKGDMKQLPELVWTAFLSQACLGLAAGVALVAITPLLVNRLLKIPAGLHTQAHWIFFILAAVLPIDFASGSLGGVLGASQRFDLVNAVAIPSSVLTYFLPAVALLLGFGLPAIVLFLAVARLAGLVISFLLCVRLYPALAFGFRFNRRLVRPLLGFGGWVAVSNLLSPIMTYFDRFIIGGVVSVAAVGFYTPPYMVATKLWILPSSLNATLFPAFSTSSGRGDRTWIRDAFVRSLKLLLLIMGPATLLLAFFARPILSFWLGSKFADEGTLVLEIMAFGVFVNSLASVPSSVLQGVGRPDLITKVQLFELLPYVVLTWFMVTTFGLVGAALAWSIRLCFEFIAFLGLACWITDTPLHLLAGRGIRRTFVTVAALALCLSVVWALSRALLADAAFTLLLGGGFLAGSWRYVLDLEERGQILTWFRVPRP